MSFITVVAADGDPQYPVLLSEYDVPFIVEELPAAGGGRGGRGAAARCGAGGG